MVNTKRLLLLLSLLLSTCVHAGAWVQEKGHGLNIFTFQRYISTNFWTSGGRQVGAPSYTKYGISDYIEYGITDRFTGGIYLSGLQSHTTALGTQRGDNDNQFFGRYQLWKNDWSVVSVQAFVDKLGNGAQFNVPPQNSQFNSGEGILLGTSGRFGTQPNQFWFFDCYLGLVQRYSAGNLAQIDMEMGWKLRDNSLWFLLQNYNTFSVDRPAYPTGVEYNLMTIAPSIVYWMNKTVGFQLGLTQDFYGQNVGKGTGPFVASWINF